MKRPKACPFRCKDGTYWARVRYVDESGKTRNKVERAENPADAQFQRRPPLIPIPLNLDSTSE